MGITLWIVPPADEASILQHVMDNPPLPKDSDDDGLGGLQKSFPHFQSHITLGSFPASTPVEKLRSAIPPSTTPLQIDFDTVETGDHYFRSVFVRVRPSSALDELHRQVHLALDVKEPNTPKFPHLSLYYIEDSRASERGEVLENMNAQGTIVKTEGSGNIELVGFANDGRTARVSGFVANEIWIAMCNGPVETWSICDKFKLN